MKALKEKRISLRSLWRRGLVILSLFALLFAACADSEPEDNGGGGGGNVYNKGKEVNRIDIWDLPATQYLGRPVDLRGIQAQITYADGSTDIINSQEEGHKDDYKKFSASPRVVWGSYDPNGGFNPMKQVVITYNDGGITGGVNTYTFGAKQVVGIVRTDTTGANSDNFTSSAKPGLTGLYNNGLMLTGMNAMATKKVYADDDKVSWSGFTMEAYYYDDAWLDIDMDYDVAWRIIPDYPQGKKADGTYRGYIYVTVGALDDSQLYYLKDDSDWDYWDPTYKPIPGVSNVPDNDPLYNTNNGGITIKIPIDTVYTVEKIEVKTESDMADYFFWDDNSPTAWTNRLEAAGASLDITYTDGLSPKNKTVSYLKAKERIWYNANPNENVIDYDFAVVPLETPFINKAKGGNPNPHLLVYYRGAVTKVFVDVFTTLQGIDVKPVEGEPPVLQLATEDDSYRDNDIEYTYGSNERAFASKIKVTATYLPYNADPKKPSAEKVLTWLRSTGTGGDNAAFGSGAYYQTNFYTVVKENGGWKGVKDGATKNIKVTHTVRTADVETRFAADTVMVSYDHNEDKTQGKPNGGITSSNATAGFMGTKASQSKNQNIAVLWSWDY